MMRKTAVLFLLFSLPFVTLTGCSKNSTGPSGTNNGASIVGSWAPDSSSEYLMDYLIFTDANEYYALGSDEMNWHTLTSGAYTISGATLMLDTLAFQYELSNGGNALTLTMTGQPIAFHRDDNAPDPNDWVRPLSITSSVELPYDLGYFPDITSDGTNLWILHGDSQDMEAMKTDTNGDSLGSVAMPRSSGLEYSGDLLWTINEDLSNIIPAYQFSGVSPENGQALSTLPILGSDTLSFTSTFIARLADAFWTTDNFRDVLLRVDATSGEITDEFPFQYVEGLTAADGKLMAFYMYSIVEVDPETGLIVETYSMPWDELLALLQTLPSFNGLAWDGTNFYTLSGELFGGSYSLVTFSTAP